MRLVRPRSFAGLMTLYESNHARLRQLLGNLQHLPSGLVSSSPTDLCIHITRYERSRYTTRLRMTYWLPVHAAAVPEPDLVLRIYHDARLVEAVSCCERLQPPVFQDTPLLRSTALPHRWSLNMLLNKWLEYCLDHRHRFSPT